MVSILGPDGCDLVLEADQWMMEMLCGWLSDRDLVRALVEDGMDPEGVRQVYWNLRAHLRDRKPYERAPLRREVLSCLKSKRARQHIHRLTCDSNLEHYEQEMADYRERLHLWLQTPEGTEAGEKPLQPDRPADAKQVREDLKRLQKEIEDEVAEEKARPERLIVT